MQAGVGRFVHISSTSAYGHPADRKTPIDETAVLGENVWILDYYTRSKVECERLLWRLAESEGLPLTVIRPSWLFGERDRTTAPRLIREFRRGRMLIVGNGDNPLSAVYAGVVADAAILAALDPSSRGEAYNITSQGRITQREFLNLFADALEVPRVTRHVPYPLAFAGGFLLEIRDRLLLRECPPRVTRYGAWLLGRHLEYSTEKARARLGWRPAIGYAESIKRTLTWFLDGAELAPAEASNSRDQQGKSFNEPCYPACGLARIPARSRLIRSLAHPESRKTTESRRLRTERSNDLVRLSAERPGAEPTDRPRAGRQSGFRPKART